MPTCSVVIPTRSRPELLRSTLESLSGQSPDEVVVVVDGPDAMTEAFAASHRLPISLRWVRLPESRGPGAARNAGALEARGEVVLFLDDDTAASPDWVRGHLKHHAAAHRADVIVLGKGLETYERPPASGRERFLREEIEHELERHERRLLAGGSGFARGCWIGLNTSIRREFFQSLRGFDPWFERTQEDVELAARALQAGASFVYEPLAITRHRSTKDLARHHAGAAPLIGRSHVYRLRDKRQSPALMPQLAWVREPLHRRALHRLISNAPRLAEIAGAICARLGEWTGSRALLRKWAQLSFAAGYWRGVREAGLDFDALAELVRRSDPCVR